jgi:hypothetical protein
MAARPRFKQGDTVHVVGKFVAEIPAEPDVAEGAASVRFSIRQTCGGFMQVIVPLRDVLLPPASANGEAA